MQNTVNVTALLEQGTGTAPGLHTAPRHTEMRVVMGVEMRVEMRARCRRYSLQGRLPGQEQRTESGRTGSVQVTRILGQYLALSEPLFTGRKGV